MIGLLIVGMRGAGLWVEDGRNEEGPCLGRCSGGGFVDRDDGREGMLKTSCRQTE